MTFPEILEAIEYLSDAELAQLQTHIQQKREQTPQPDLLELDGLSNEALWAIVHDSFDGHKDNQLRELRELRELRDLTPDEDRIVTELLNELHQFVFYRSMAMATLQNRGIDVMKVLADV